MPEYNINWTSPASSTDRGRTLDLGLLILRIGISSLMLFGHGAGKLVNYAEYAQKFGDPIGLGPQMSLILVIFAEFFCSLAVALGLLTRLASIPLIVTMFVAAFIVHAADPFQKMELPLLFLACYLAILCTGPGKYSVDYLLFGRRQ